MIHTSRFDGTRCGGTLLPYGPRGFYPAADHRRCEECGQVGVPYIPTENTKPPRGILVGPCQSGYGAGLCRT